MTCNLCDFTADRFVARVDRFDEPPRLIREPLSRRSITRRVVVRVTHASVGVTDVAAARGDYLLHPIPRFVAGYDFVGIIEHLPHSTSTRLIVGQRVTGILPHQGAHATHVAVLPSLLVPAPDSLESPTAATVPLDAVTADLALDALALEHGSILIQGAGGAVGAWAVQLARKRGLTVFGTGSERSRLLAENFGATVLDYRDPAWIDVLVKSSGGGVAGAIDHTGARDVRRAVRADGRIARIAFGGAPGRQRSATATGFVKSAMRSVARPAERICSAPFSVVVHRERYRARLGELLQAVRRRELLAPNPRLFPLDDYGAALDAAADNEPGTKVILAAADH